MKHLLELLDATVQRWQDRPAFGDEHGTLTWHQVGLAVHSIGTAMTRHKVQRRPVALYLDHEVPCLLAMLSTLAAGGYYTVLDTAQPPERVRRITDQLEPALLVTDAAHRAAAEALGLNCPILDVADGPLCAADPAGGSHRYRSCLRSVHLRFHRRPQGGGRTASRRTGLQRLGSRNFRH